VNLRDTGSRIGFDTRRRRDKRGYGSLDCGAGLGRIDRREMRCHILIEVPLKTTSPSMSRCLPQLSWGCTLSIWLPPQSRKTRLALHWCSVSLEP